MRGFLALMAALIIIAVNINAGGNGAADGQAMAAAGMTALPHGDITQGYIISEQACAQCHAVDPGEPHSPDSAAPAFPDIAAAPGLTPAAIEMWLRTSHPPMPDIRLSDAEKNNIAAYLLALKTG